MSALDEDWLALIERLENGDAEALIKLTRAITSVLARQGAYRIRDSWDDLCQEVLIALLDSLRRQAFREPRAVLGYIATVTRNKLADWLRRSGRPADADALGDPELAAATQQETLPEWADHDAHLDLEQALTRLPERQRQVVEHVYLLGHSYDQAAALLDLPLGTLKREQTQGLKALRGLLGVRGPP